MRIITYNMRFGGPVDPNWSWVVPALCPDILLAQESRSPPSSLHSRSVWSAVDGQTWGSAVYVRQGTVTALALGAFGGWLAGAEVDESPYPVSKGRRLRVFSLHALPLMSSGWGGYPQVVNAMLDVIERHRGDADLIIGGDFNITVSARHSSERQNGAPWTTTSQERAFQTRLRQDFGLINCWQTANPDVPLAQTLRWNNDPVSSFHIDGIFVPASCGIRPRCTVVDREEWAELSDHNPVVATVTREEF